MIHHTTSISNQIKTSGKIDFEIAKKKRPTIYAFIDSQNLNLGVHQDIIHKGRKLYKGWRLDFPKFRIFLAHKYRVEVAFLFIGNLPGNEDLYARLQQAGYVLVLKPTTTFHDHDGHIRVKGNVDTDLVLYAAAKKFNSYDRAVIVSGDGDFLSLYDYLVEHQKLEKILIPNKMRYSQLLNKYAEYFDFVSQNRLKLQNQRHQK